MLTHGDCMHHLPEVPEHSVDLILCDLPYGTTRCRWDIVIPFEPLWAQYWRILKPDGAVVLFGSEPFSSHLRISQLEHYKYDWVWEKGEATGHLNSKKQPLRAHEFLHVFYRNQPHYSPQKTEGHERKVSLRGDQISEIYGKQTPKVPYDSTSRYPRSVIRFSKDKQRIRLHPTQKPVELLKYMIKTYTREGEVVLDNCMGSGSTGVAALELDRKFIGIESDPGYFSHARSRIDEVLLQRGKEIPWQS